MTCAMRPEFERGAGTGQWHGGPMAAIIDTVGDYALIMALRRGLPTINFRVDYLRPAIKTRPHHHRHGAPRRQERGRRRCRRIQRPEGAARGRPRDLFDAAGLGTHTVRTLLHRRGDVGATEGFMTNKVSRRAFGAGVLATGLIGKAAPSLGAGRAQARRHPGGDLGRRRAAGLLRAGRRRFEPDLLLLQAVRAAGQPPHGRRVRGRAGGELEARRRLQVLHDQAPQRA